MQRQPVATSPWREASPPLSMSATRAGGQSVQIVLRSLGRDELRDADNALELGAVGLELAAAKFQLPRGAACFIPSNLNTPLVGFVNGYGWRRTAPYTLIRIGSACKQAC